MTVLERKTVSPVVAPQAVAKAFRIAAIIVHYRTPRMLCACVAGLLEQIDAVGAPRDHVFVVDNASGLEALVQIAAIRAYPDVTVLESATNLGFAGANNAAIERVQREGGAEYFLLLNPDTILRPRALATLLCFLEEHPDAACVGPRLEDLDGTPQQSAFNDPTPISEFLRGASIGPLSRLLRRWQVYGQRDVPPQTARPAQWLAGACVLLRASMLERAGLLDDGFFMYFEEVDFFRRARHLGLQGWYEPAARVVHLVGQSSGVNILPGQRRLPAYWFESRHRYFRKHFGFPGLLAADAFWLLGHLLDRARKLLTGVSHASVAQREAADLLRHLLRQVLHPRRWKEPLQ